MKLAAIVAVVVSVLAVGLGGAQAQSEELPPISNSALDVVAPVVGGVRVAGRTIQGVEPTSVLIYVDGASIVVLADEPRPDIAPFFPGYGINHGFDAVLGADPGPHRVCVYALRDGAGSLIDCRDVTVPGLSPAVSSDRSPIGWIDEAVYLDGGELLVNGWTLDPDTATPIDVMLYLDDRAVELEALGGRFDIGLAHPAWGPFHGFSALLGVDGPGMHRLCAYGLNVGAGSNSELRCMALDLADIPPEGTIDKVVVSPGAITVAGWALDRDTFAQIEVHVYVDGGMRAFKADAGRYDVSLVYPRMGQQHGLVARVGASPGVRRVCAYGINDAAGGINTELGCRTVIVP